MDMVYIRTDKNGTKIYHDWKCPRCGGAGFADKWIATGRVCFACGGTGKRAVAKIVKEYTPEYFAKLQEKQRAKDEKRREEAAKYAAEHADEIAEHNRRAIERVYKEHGCGADGIGYVLRGNTYPVKEEIKKNGGRWIYGVWICPVEIKGQGITARRIDLNGHVGSGSVTWLNGYDIYDEITKEG